LRELVYQLERGTPSTINVCERYMEIQSSVSLETLRREITERVRPTCTDMPEAEFEKMVTRMALIEWKHFNDATPTRRQG
jgi:hypothetical protein